MSKRKTAHAELQALLDSPLNLQDFLPLVESCSQVLLLQDLSWENFERLCARLIAKDGAVYE